MFYHSRTISTLFSKDNFTWFLRQYVSFPTAPLSFVVTCQRSLALTILMIALLSSFIVLCGCLSRTRLTAGSSGHLLTSCGCPSRNSCLNPLDDSFCPLTSLSAWLPVRIYLCPNPIGFLCCSLLVPCSLPIKEYQ